MSEARLSEIILSIRLRTLLSKSSDLLDASTISQAKAFLPCLRINQEARKKCLDRLQTNQGPACASAPVFPSVSLQNIHKS